MALIDKIDHAPLQSMYRYWLGLRPAGRRMPARSQIRPEDIPALLPHLFLVDVLPQTRDSQKGDSRTGRRYRLRLVGTHIAEHMGTSLTGRYLEEIATGALYDRYRHFFDAVATGPAVHYLASELYWRNRDWMMYRRLLLPLSDDDRTVNMLLGAGFYELRDSLDDGLRRLDETVTMHELENELQPL